MNHHLRFADGSSCPRTRRGSLAALAVCALAVPLFTSCQSTNERLLSVRESVPPKLAKDKPLLQVQCYFFSAPENFRLLESTEGAHNMGIYSPQDGEKLVNSLQKKRGVTLTSTPSLTLRQGKRGKLEVIREFIYPTEYTPAKLAKPDGGSFPVTPATPTNFETTHLGVMAEFEGRKNSRNEIDLKFGLERRTFLGFINYGSPITTTATTAFGKPVDVTISENRIEMPIFDLRRINSSITLADGNYLALGGLTPTTAPPSRIKHPTPTDVPEDAKKTFFVILQVKAVDEAGN